MSDFIGDPTCKYNALSEHIRCSVRPFGPCDGCLDYVKVREYVPSVSIQAIAPPSDRETFDYRLKVTLLRVWCFLSTPLELLQITCLITFVSLVFFDLSVFSDQYLLQEFQRYLRSIAHLYVIYRI